jgi:Bax protein
MKKTTQTLIIKKGRMFLMPSNPVKYISIDKLFFSITVLLFSFGFFLSNPRQEAPRNGQPLIVLPTERPDFLAFTDVNLKKQAFFDFLEPSVALKNQQITKQREKLKSIQSSSATDKVKLSTPEQALVEALSEQYYLTIPTGGIDNDWLVEMLLRVNVLPEALVLTQAANESAWGTSRFAVEANNYFGQWCYRAGCGLIPLKRVEGATHEVAEFASATDSVNAYFMNVNRNRAYSALRNIRAEIDAQNGDLHSEDTAHRLTNGLLSYSERGQDYVDDLQTMIRINNKYWNKN